MLICNSKLTSEQLKALNNLADLCRSVDKDLPPLYAHILEQKRITDNNFLYFQEDSLIGFLSVYFFYADACEISVMIAPSHRRQGIARQLIETALPLVEAKEINTLLFSTSPGVNEAWLTRFGFYYKNSEYHMERNSYEPVLISKHALTVRKATASDLPALCSIDELCFPVEQDNMLIRFINVLNDNNYTIMLAFLNDKAIAKAHVRWEADVAVLSDIAVMPHYQKQGLGGELLAHCINQALMLGKMKLALDVETSNQSALNLYTRYGFKTVNAIDFWAISPDKLRALL